jgi:hypothetical protein
MKPFIKKVFQPMAKLLLSVGYDPRKTLALRHYPKYRKHYKEFQHRGGKITNRFMILSDFDEQAGTAKGHYFHQDLLVASLIHEMNPKRHIDIGSRIDGFVAHVAAFRKIEVIDVRDLAHTGHENIVFMKADLMDATRAPKEITDSLSCLHVIEHFGLGRYGDPIDPDGHIKGFNNILGMLKPDGTLFISFPIANQNEVHFNAHRAFHPKDIFTWMKEPDRLKLERFDYVDDAGDLHKNVDLNQGQIDIKYGCGIYTLRKLY